MDFIGYFFFFMFAMTCIAGGGGLTTFAYDELKTDESISAKMFTTSIFIIGIMILSFGLFLLFLPFFCD